ncbi:MAG TPA: glycosyltransferase [Longimicrobiales bacterium]
MPIPDLILFTRAFPFGNAESFLETEVDYLAEAFSHAWIVPRSVDGRSRPVPRGVLVDTSLAERHRRAGRKLAKAARVLSPMLVRDVLARGRTGLNQRAWRRALEFRASAARAEKWLQDRLAPLERAGCKPVLYSYWLQPETLAAVLFKRHDPRVVVATRAHGGDLYEHRHEPSYLPFRPAIFAGADRVYCVSEHGRRYLAERYPQYEDRFRLARLGVDAPGFVTSPSRDGRFRIVSCSFMVPLKRIDLLIDSIAEFAGRRPSGQVVWHHIGDGPKRMELEAHCRARLGDHVEWRLLGALPNADVIAYYRAHPVDAFVNVSASEGVPVSIMEAQSCGIPVIATAVGGTPEIVNDDNGILLPEDPDPPCVARALEKLASDPERAARWRGASRATWAACCDAGRNYRDFARELHALRGAPVPPARASR